MFDQGVLTTLFEAMGDGVCISDDDFKILYLNPAAQRMMKVSLADIEAASICELMAVSLPTPGLRQCVENCPLRDKNSPQKAVHHQLEGLRIRCLAMPGDLLGAGKSLHLTFIEDNSAELELERYKEDWRHMVAHDLRTPMTVIRGALGALSGIAPGQPIGAQEKSILEMSSRSAARMIEMLNHYLDIAKLDASLMPVRHEPVALGELVGRAVEEQKLLAQSRRVELAAEIPAGLGVRADPELLFRVVENLLNNAIQFTLEGTRVEITARQASDGGVSLSFKDAGPGISAEDLPRIFDRFYQAQARREGRTQGTGLGLTFCRQAMGAMGGRIEVLSMLGRGSEFVVQLPGAGEG